MVARSAAATERRAETLPCASATESVGRQGYCARRDQSRRTHRRFERQKKLRPCSIGRSRNGCDSSHQSRTNELRPGPPRTRGEYPHQLPTRLGGRAMMHFFGRLVGLVTIALVMPLWVEAAELSSQPIDGVRFEPKLVLDIKAKSMAGPSVQLDENNLAHVAWMEEKENVRT